MNDGLYCIVGTQKDTKQCVCLSNAMNKDTAEGQLPWYVSLFKKSHKYIKVAKYPYTERQEGEK